MYDRVLWTWNLGIKKLKGVLPDLGDMLEPQSVTNELAMKVSGKVSHYAPLFPGSRWWRKALTSLPDQKAGKRKIVFLSASARRALEWWIMMFPNKDPLYLFPSYFTLVFTDASGVHANRNALMRRG